MDIKNRIRLLVKVSSSVLLGGGIVFANYIEGTDTTDVNGYGLDSAFRVISGYMGGWTYARYLFFSPGCSGYFNYAFEDIKIAPASIKQSANSQAGMLSYCMVVKNRDSTWAKITIIQQISGNRYLFKYGKNTTPNDRLLIKANYDSTVLYKPNNLYNSPSPYPAPTAYDTISWEPPLTSKNQLIGYILYESKSGVVIDTTLPINLTQWDSVAFTTLTILPSFIFRNGAYFNLVAVYAEGKSDFLLGWSRFMYSLDAVKNNSSLPSYPQSIKINKTSLGFTISFLPSNGTDKISLSIFTSAGVRVAQFSGANSNSIYWKTRGLAEGTYLIKAQLPDGSVLTRNIVVLR